MLKRSIISTDGKVASWSWYWNQQGTSTDDLHFDRCRTSSLSNLFEFLAPLSTQSTSSKEINWTNYRDEWNAKADCISHWAWLVQKDGRAFVYVVQVSSFFVVSCPLSAFVLFMLSIRESISDRQLPLVRTINYSRVRSRRHELFPRMTAEVEQISGTTSSSRWREIEGRKRDEGDGWDRSAVQNSWTLMGIDNICYLYRLMIFAFFNARTLT